MRKSAKGPKPDKSILWQMYLKESKSIREIAESLDCTKDMIFRTLQEYGIERRSNKRRSSLRKHRLSILERGIKSKGIRGYAREIGLDESTLRHHIRIRRKSE